MVDLVMLAAATSKMRTAQKAYFKRRSQSTLSEAKATEEEVDRLLGLLSRDHVAVRANLIQQTNLFG